MTIAYENLDLIPTLLTLVTDLKKEVEILKSLKIKLRTNKEVIEYLDIGRTTLHNYIKTGVLVKDKHYIYKNNKIIFITEAIMKFKEQYVKHAKVQHKTTIHVNNFMSEFVA